MRVEPDGVEQDYRREERREHKAMESELSGAKIEKLEDLLEKHQGTDGEAASAVMATVQEVLQYVYVANDQVKGILDDFDQKWSHTAQQFEINRKFARAQTGLPAKTDWREDSAAKSAKSKQQQPHQ